MAAVLSKPMFADAREQIRNLEPALRRIAEEVVFPAHGRNYQTSGLRKQTHLLYTAMTRPGFDIGQIYRVSGNTLEIGIDPSVIKYAKYVVEGRPAVVAKRGKALRFYGENGKVIFRKRVKAAPPHRLFYLTAADLEKAQQIVSEMIGKDWTVRLR